MTKYDSPQLIPENFSQKHTLTLVGFPCDRVDGSV